MIIRVPNREIKEWLWPEILLSEWQYMEMRIEWEGKPVAYPYQITNRNGDPCKKFTREEAEKLKRCMKIEQTAGTNQGYSEIGGKIKCQVTKRYYDG